MGQPFDYSVQIDELGELRVSASAVSSTWKKLAFYFKAGAYVIDNKGAATEGGLVVYESFDVFNGAVQT